ncbi:hypothetical protein P3342_011034 [Pyrenophora teres f. teres]|nr:hypothetical protein P3342_011034 [Pyrenophora teres f. teres]
MASMGEGRNTPLPLLMRIEKSRIASPLPSLAERLPFESIAVRREMARTTPTMHSSNMGLRDHCDDKRCEDIYKSPTLPAVMALSRISISFPTLQRTLLIVTTVAVPLLLLS